MSYRLIHDEVLLRQNPNRKALYPIKNPKLWSYYKKAQSLNWTAEEIKFGRDLEDWEQLAPDVKEVLTTVLAFFSGADAIVNDNLAENFCRKIDILEVKCFYSFQMYIENVHNEVYSLMIENLVKDSVEKDRLLNACEKMPHIQKLYKWAERWIHRTPEDEMNENPTLQQYIQEGASEEVVEDLAEIWCFAKQLIAFACVEGIMFSGAFAIIFWVKEMGVLPGLTFSNELISRDEGLHRDFACFLYSLLVHKPPADQILQIVEEAVECNQELIGTCMDRLVGMNRTDMNQYISYVGDNLLVNLGYSKRYNCKNPFVFMEKISFNGMTNFFERRVGEYGISGFEEGHDEEIELDDDY